MLHRLWTSFTHHIIPKKVCTRIITLPQCSAICVFHLRLCITGQRGQVSLIFIWYHNTSGKGIVTRILHLTWRSLIVPYIPHPWPFFYIHQNLAGFLCGICYIWIIWLKSVYQFLMYFFFNIYTHRQCRREHPSSGWMKQAVMRIVKGWSCTKSKKVW